MVSAEVEVKGKEELRRLEKKCKSILISYIADSHLEHVQEKTRAKEIFDTLKSIFERKSIANQLYIRKKLLSTKYDEREDMNIYLLNFDKSIRQLKESGAHVEELDAICHLLISLPKSYDAVVVALETMEQETRLLDEYNKRKNNLNVSLTQTAFSTFKFKCYGCGKVGHKRSDQ